MCIRDRYNVELITSAIRPIVRPFQGSPETIQPITELVTIIQLRQVTALVMVRGKRSNHLGLTKDIMFFDIEVVRTTIFFRQAASLLVRLYINLPVSHYWMF